MTGSFDFSRIAFDDAQKAIAFCDSHSRLPALLDIHHRMNDADWLRLLGKEWSGCDNIGHYIDDLFDTPLCWTFEPSATVRREMMTPEETVAYEALPDVVTIYRGCYKKNKWGFSWSLSEEIAAQFPSLNRYRQPDQALLVKATVKKENIIALKLDRDESEIITWRPKHVSTRHLSP